MTTTSSRPDPRPVRLEPVLAGRVWGRADLSPWYPGAASQAQPIGEAWLTGPECAVAGQPGQTLATFAGRHPGLFGAEGFPLLVKLLFPADKLSVQVHPDDGEARALGLARGKTECWYVLDAEPGAEVACGLIPGTPLAEVERAVREERLEALLRMVPVHAGDMVFVDAGTVHAVGPGMTLLEVQQTCDVTYRLYDYGRPRELHLAEGLRVVKPETRAGKVLPREHVGYTRLGYTRLIEERYFTVDRMDRAAATEEVTTLDGPGCFVGLAGSFALDGVAFAPGEAVVAAAGRYTLQCIAPGSVVRAQAPSVS